MMPQPRKPDICRAQSVISAIHPRSSEGGEQTVEDFASDRFEVYADNHHSAIMGGSTYAADEETSAALLDACAIGFGYDENGVRKTMAQATADGLGHPHEEQALASISEVTNYVSEGFVQEILCSPQTTLTSKTLNGTFIQIGKGSRKHALNMTAKQKYDSTSALTASVIDLQINTAIIGNIGDAMTVILSGKDFSLIDCCPARQYQRMGACSPESLQAFANAKTQARLARYEEKAVKLSPNDIIIQLTDGFWEALPHEVNPLCDSQQIEIGKYTRLKARTLQNYLHTKFPSPEKREAASAFELLKAIADYAFIGVLADRNDLKTLTDTLKTFIANTTNQQSGEILLQLKQSKPSLFQTVNTRLVNEILPHYHKSLRAKISGYEISVYAQALNTKQLSLHTKHIYCYPKNNQWCCAITYGEMKEPEIFKFLASEPIISTLNDALKSTQADGLCILQPEQQSTLYEAIEKNSRIQHYKQSLINTEILTDFLNGERQDYPIDWHFDAIIQLICAQAVGDCATLSVTRVPHYQDELIRACIDTPQHAAELLPRIFSAIKEDELQPIIQRLGNEKVIARDKTTARGISPNKRQWHYQYKKQTLQVLFERLKWCYKNKDKYNDATLQRFFYTDLRLHISPRKEMFKYAGNHTSQGDLLIEVVRLNKTEHLQALSKIKSRNSAKQKINPYDQRDSYGLSALHYACRYGYQAMLQYLLANKANPTLFSYVHGTQEGYSPLHYAIAGHHFEIMLLLLQQKKVNINCMGRYQRSPLYTAVQFHADAPLVKHLITCGANPNVPDSQRSTPLHLAARSGQIGTLCILLELPDIKANACNNQSLSPFGTAIFYNQTEAAQCLHDHGLGMNKDERDYLLTLNRDDIHQLLKALYSPIITPKPIYPVATKPRRTSLQRRAAASKGLKFFSGNHPPIARNKEPEAAQQTRLADTDLGLQRSRSEQSALGQHKKTFRKK